MPQSAGALLVCLLPAQIETGEISGAQNSVSFPGHSPIAMCVRGSVAEAMAEAMAGRLAVVRVALLCSV